MCTVVVLHRVHPDFPVIIAANRDEFYARPATAPQVLSDSPRIAGGVDQVGGGTWMGVTATGFFAGVTNQRTYRPPDRNRQSRGQLVLDALRAGSTSAVDQLLAARNPRQTNAFNLIYGSAEGLRVAYARDDQPRIHIADVPTGLHVLPNAELNSAEFPKVDRARALIEPYIAPAGESASSRAAHRLMERPWNELQPILQTALADHAEPPADQLPPLPPESALSAELVRHLHALCIHTEHYGTRSASFVALRPGGVAHYEFADGPLCRHQPYDVLADLLTASPGSH